MSTNTSVIGGISFATNRECVTKFALAAVLTVSTPMLAHAEDASTQTLDEIVVTAPQMTQPLIVETDPSNPRQPVPAADGGGYLKSIPGFSLIRKGGISGDPVFRGQAGSRLNILLDGTPLFGGCSGRMDPPTAYVFPDSYDSIKVLKGPQSVVYGGGTSGATILMERKPEQFDDLGARASVSALFGSNARNDQMLDAAAGVKLGYVRGTATHSHSDDYRDGNDSKIHSNYDRKSGSFGLGWTPDSQTNIEFSVDVSEAEAAYADRSMDGSKFDRRDFKLEASRTAISPLISKVEAQIYHNYIDHVMDRFSLREYTGGMMAALSNPERTNMGGKLNVELTPTDKLGVKGGIDFNRDLRTNRILSAANYTAGVNYEDLARDNDMAFSTYGLFTEVDYVTSDVGRVIGGYRFSRVEVEDPGTSGHPTDDDNLHNAFVRYEHDVVVDIPMTAYAGLGHTQRAPDYWERDDTFDIRAEKQTQLDLGLMHQSQEWRWSVSGFYTRATDYILTSGSQAKNVNARMYGGEAEIAYSFLPSWTAEATLAYVRGDNRTDNTALAQMSPLESTFAIKYDDGTFTGGALLRAVAKQNRVDVGWGNIVGQDIGETGGFGVLSANVGWRPVKDGQIAFGVDNIFDKTYAEHLSKSGTSSLASSGFEQTTRVNEPGRTFWLKGSIRF